MARAARPIATNPAQVRQAINEANTFNPRMIKEIEATYRGDLDPGAEALLASETVYPVWREFLKAYSDKYGPIPADGDPVIISTFTEFGDVHTEFQTWWLEGGRELFRENGEIPLVTVENIDEQWTGEDDYPKSITLRIPLTVPRENIDLQIRNILKQCHMGRRLYRHQAGKAQRKLHPRSMYVSENFKRMLRVWKIAITDRAEDMPEDQKKPWWRVAHEALLAPHIDPYHDTLELLKEEARRHLAKLASDLNDQAIAVMHNAIRGVFPKDTIDGAPKKPKKSEKTTGA
jgi:hypothetical protein